MIKCSSRYEWLIRGMVKYFAKKNADLKELENHSKWIEEVEKTRADLLSKGYILESDGIYYTERDILDGKCPLNGTLTNAGYILNSDGITRSKK